jgi:TrmH family RNA methyltransferase
MTGREGGADLAPPPGESPIIVLVRPQLADNIGAAARAMANGGLFHLRLVAPRDGWPQDRAWRMASGADRILEAAAVYPDLPSALADCHRVFATCPRPRHVVKPLRTARAAAEDLRGINVGGLRAAVLFGPERAGLDNDDMACADTLVRYPLNPDHMSLNLAQAVMILAYEWWTVTETAPPRELMTNERVSPRRASWKASSAGWRRSSTPAASSTTKRSAPAWCGTCVTGSSAAR